jgi:hypothetical protein
MIAVRTKPPAYLDTQWPGLMQIARIERRRELRTFCQRQVIYAITSLPPERGEPAALLALARQHWHIENRLFHVRDVTFGEDLCQVRSGSAPMALTLLRDTVLSYIRRQNRKPRPAREAYAARPKAAIRDILKL